MRNSVVRLHHPTAVRSAAFSCSQACPVHAVVGLDNGSLYRLASYLWPLHYTYLTIWHADTISQWVLKGRLTVYPLPIRGPSSRLTGVPLMEASPVLVGGLPVAHSIGQSKSGTSRVHISNAHRPIRSRPNFLYVAFAGVRDMSARSLLRQTQTLDAQCRT
jgi:hypothetical protein